MTKFGETHNFQGNDFVRKIETYIGRQVDGIICNNRKPNNRLLKKYLAEKSEFIEIEQLETRINNRLIFANDLLDSSDVTVRHDPQKLASLIQSIIFREHCLERGKLINDPISTQFNLKDSVKMPIKYKSLKALQRIA
jgi:hypothetical protein